MICSFYTQLGRVHAALSLFLLLNSGIYAKVQVNAYPLSDNIQQLCVLVDNPQFQSVYIDAKEWFLPKLCEGAHTLEKGAPQLPVISRNVLLPETGDVSVRVTVKSFHDYTNTPVAPSKGPLPRSINPASVPYSFNETYHQAYWPQKIVETGTPYILRKHRGVTLRICPFQYYPAEQRLRLFTELEIIVSARGTNGLNTFTRRTVPVSRDNRVFESIYASHFVNYIPSLRRYSPLPDTNDYMLVISVDALIPYAQPLVDWKNQRGIHTVMVPLSSVGSTTAQIKDYVQSYYNTNGLTYLLLVGDGEDLPSPHVSQGASDPTYSKLAGSDNYPDIFVGRLCSSSTDDISTMVQRTIAYEKNATTSDSWYTLATGLASDEGSSPSDIEHMNSIRSNLLANGYSTVDRLYDPGVTVSQVADPVNRGRGLINYVGHGNYTEWITSGFSNSDVNNLTNTTRWPFIFDVACLNGCFTGRTCFAEAWTCATYDEAPSGAIAIYASTVEQEWDPPMTAQNEFNSLLTNSDIHSFGALCFNASMKMMDDWGSTGVDMFNTWTVFGDPSFLVRTAVPKILSVTHDEHLSTTIFTVSVASVKGALAAISVTNKLLACGYTDSGGTCVLTLSDYPRQDALLTVTAFNGIMYTSTLITSQADLSCEPALFEQTLTSGHSTNTFLTVSNAGETGSILDYSITLFPDYSHPRRDSSIPLSRSIAGSTLSLDTSEFTRGATTTLTVTVQNNSNDDEWIKAATLTLPSNVTIEGATKLAESSWGLTYDGTTGTAATITWETDDPQNDAVSVAATGTVTLSFSASTESPIELEWVLTGDGFAAAPHSTTGTIILTATAPPSPAINLLAPNGGESWLIGSTQDIEWSSINYTNGFTIDYSPDSGASWNQIVDDLPLTNRYSWHLSMTNQSSNSLIRITAATLETAATSAAPFSVYHALDWLNVSPSSGSITGNVSDHITVSFNATGKTNGTYHARLQVYSPQETILIPVTLYVSNAITGWVITPTTGSNGHIIPATAVAVTNGGSTSFVVTAESGYYISAFYTNGTSVYGTAGLTIYTSKWHQVTSNGTLHATFAETATETATNNTPIPWLRQYYTNEPTVEALAEKAILDTDGDRMAGWEEYVAATDPTDKDSAFNRFVIMPGEATYDDILTWYAATGRLYSVYFTESLHSSFLLLTNNLISNTNGWYSFTNRNTQSCLFYKLIVEPLP